MLALSSGRVQILQLAYLQYSRSLRRRPDTNTFIPKPGLQVPCFECVLDRPQSQAALRTNLQHQKHRATHSEAIFQPCSQPHLVSAERLHAHAVLGPKTGNLHRCWDQTAPPVSERRLTAGRWTASTWEIYLELHRKRVSPEEWVAHR
jgi:hypothetical protein